MSNHEQINPVRSRRAVQDQSGPGSTQRFQNTAQLSSEFGIHAQIITGWKRTLMDPTDRLLSINQQGTLLSLPRSSYYYQPAGEPAQNLALMEQIDKLFTARPEMGVRRIYYKLKTPDNTVNIKRIHRSMRLMDLEAVGPKPNLSKPQPGHTIYPYLLKGLIINRPNQVWWYGQPTLLMCHY